MIVAPFFKSYGRIEVEQGEGSAGLRTAKTHAERVDTQIPGLFAAVTQSISIPCEGRRSVK